MVRQGHYRDIVAPFLLKTSQCVLSSSSSNSHTLLTATSCLIVDDIASVSGT